VHVAAEKYNVLFVEKSRTMMASSWVVAEDVHYVATHPPAGAIFWAQDQDRSLVLHNYAWTLWEQSIPEFKSAFPVARPRERLSFDVLGFASGAKCIALPGKDPAKIRSLHPARLIMDEAAFIEDGAEAFDVAISSKVPKVKVISSAAPGWFYDAL
jgi:phage FluMu gp28-like protein